MMKFLLPVFLLWLSGCSYPDEPKTIDVHERYQINIPAYFDEVENEQENVVAQYESKFRNRYLLLVRDLKAGRTLPEFMTEKQEELQKYLEEAVVVRSDSFEVNQIPAADIIVSGKAAGERVYYHLVFYEGEEHLYQLVLWVPERKKDAFSEDINSIIQSFRRK